MSARTASATSALAALLTIVAAPTFAQDMVPVSEAPAALGTSLVVVPALTPLSLRIDTELSSKKSKTGDRFPIHIDEDVRVGDVVVIPAGSAGEGEVIHAAKSGAGGKAGELLVAARYVRVGDQEVKLRSLSLGAAGKDRSAASLGTSMVIGPLAMFVVGGVMTIARDTVATAKTAIELHMPAAAPSNATAAPQPVETPSQSP